MKRIFLIVKTWVQHLCEMPSRHPKDTRRAVRLERLAARRPFAGDLTLPPGGFLKALAGVGAAEITVSAFVVAGTVGQSKWAG